MKIIVYLHSCYIQSPHGSLHPGIDLEGNLCTALHVHTLLLGNLSSNKKWKKLQDPVFSLNFSYEMQITLKTVI